MNRLHTQPSSSDLAAKILARIETQNITPASRWRYTGKNALFWLLWTLSILIGSVAVSVTIFSLANSGWEYYLATHRNFFTFFVDAIPFLWILALIVATVVGYENFRHTRHGYRASLPLVLLICVFSSLSGGFILYVVGFAPIADEAVGEPLPLYDPVTVHQQQMWVNPDSGLLAGTVTGFEESLASFTLQSFDGVEWQVATDELTYEDFITLERHATVRVVGISNVETSQFYACFVFPWSANPASAANGDASASVLVLECGTECEMFSAPVRSTRCKDVRPYEFLTSLRTKHP